MINTVIFDIGFVLVNFDFTPYIHSKFNDEICEVISKSMWGSEYWHEFDLGNKTTEEVIDLFVSAAPSYEKEMREALMDFGQCMKMGDYVMPWIEDLKKKGIRVLYLSNWSDFLLKANPEEMSFLSHMDGGVFSCDVHLTKPDRRIYEYICEKYDLRPEECIFVDDLDRNVEAACDYGIHGIVFEGYQLTRQNMWKML